MTEAELVYPDPESASASLDGNAPPLFYKWDGVSLDIRLSALVKFEWYILFFRRIDSPIRVLTSVSPSRSSLYDTATAQLTSSDSTQVCWYDAVRLFTEIAAATYNNTRLHRRRRTTPAIRASSSSTESTSSSRSKKSFPIHCTSPTSLWPLMRHCVHVAETRPLRLHSSSWVKLLVAVSEHLSLQRGSSETPA